MRTDLNLEELRDLIEDLKRPIIVCNLDCGSQTNDACLFQIGLNAETSKFEVKTMAYQYVRAHACMRGWLGGWVRWMPLHG